jgi:dinuclear metal center YbgI/SA1388 family protein
MRIQDIINAIEEVAPLSLQESYDNAGLIIGNSKANVTSALITIDVTETVIEEAIEKRTNLIIAHHPIIFTGLKKITGANYVERCIEKAIKNDIAIYASHTNMDNAYNGVSFKIAEKLNLQNPKILVPFKEYLYKLVVFVPSDHSETIRKALFDAGAGNIGEYDACSYNLKGYGSFRGSEKSNPFVGKKGEIHFEEEERIETIFPKQIMTKVINTLIKAHPYEEPAYDIYPLKNDYPKAGSGIIGKLTKPVTENDLLDTIKNEFKAPVLKHTQKLNKKVQKIALCGGSGSHTLRSAISQKADVFISSDIKYHQFFDAESKILIIDVGHYESEQFTKEIFYSLIDKKFSNFALYFSETDTNPINYYY